MTYPVINDYSAFVFILTLTALTWTACDQVHEESGSLNSSEEVSLQEIYSDYFLIGSAINQRQVNRNDSRGVPLIKKHFNTVTAENIMKWQHIHPEPGNFDFSGSDQFVEFAEANDMFIIGHTLVWHSQIPGSAFEDEDGNLLDREAMIERMRKHIHTIVGRYKGRVHGWDVVNEALNQDGSLRESLWYQIIGEDYIRLAFKFAHEADPDAELYYNDYSLENPSKREGAIRLVRQLQEAGAPITGIGTQGHFHIPNPSLEEIERTIVEFSELGIDVMVTELDIDVLPPAMDYQGADVNISVELQDELNPYADGLPEYKQQELTQRYKDIFEVYLKHHEHITRVTFWGVTDGDSWKNNWPVRGRTNYPLLFDRNGDPKPAFDAVIEVVQNYN
jgi:endo-1,4-beta-xylanase